MRRHTMTRVYIGVDGQYEIYSKNSIIKTIINKLGEKLEKYKVYNSVNNIPSGKDREIIEGILNKTDSEIKINGLPESQNN